MIFVIDAWYLTLSLLICIGWQLGFFLIAGPCKFDKVTDLVLIKQKK